MCSTKAKGNGKMKNEDYSDVHVGNFPRKIWRVFSAYCKAEGITVKEGLEKALRRWITDKGKM